MTVLSRRSVLAGAAGGAALAAVSPRAAFASSAREARQALATGRMVGERPDLTRPAGEPHAGLPFKNIVVVMMENHSFDTYLGMLPKRGQPKADGFTFDGKGRPLNSNPVPGDTKGGRIRSFRMTSTCQGDVSQAWDATHAQINGGRMDGFVGSTGGAANDNPDGLLRRGGPAVLLLAGEDLPRLRTAGSARHRVRPTPTAGSWSPAPRRVTSPRRATA